MRFFGTTVVKSAYVDTDEGCFKAYEDGTMERWVDDEDTGQGNYRWFDESKFPAEDMAFVRQQGKAALEMS